MTPEKHNKLLGFAHLGYAGLTVFFFGLMMIWMVFVFSLEPGPPPPVGLFVGMGLFMLFFLGLYTIPSLIAGYALLKRRSWAKVASIIAGVMCAMSAPFGTALCAYTFWFLFSEPGKILYDQPQQALPPMPPTWHQQATPSREPVFTQATTPPDWR